MVNWIEIGLFLYALAGSATTGYWFLVSFSPAFRERDRTTKLGYSVITGMIYTGVIFFVSILLVGQYKNMNFLETFFWLIPISFVLLMLTAGGKRAWILAERAQYGEQGKPAESREEKLGTSILARQTMMEKIPEATPIPSAGPVAENQSIISDSSQTVEAEQETEEKIGEEETEEKEGRTEETGETEKDVAEEIRKIMKSESSETTKSGTQSGKSSRDLEEKEEIRKIMGTQDSWSEGELPSALSATPTGMNPSEIEKIKEELKKKIRAKEAAEKIKEGLKRKETRKK